MNKKSIRQGLLARAMLILVLALCSTLFINFNSFRHVSAEGLEVKQKGSESITITETRNSVSSAFSSIKIAAVQASLKKEYKYGIGTMNRLEIVNINDSAKYIYESSDTSVISIFRDEYFDCKKFGTATLTVYEKYKGKKTKIGTTKVHVVKAQFREKYMTIRIDDNPYNDSPIEYKVEHAPYKYFSVDKSILEVDENTGTLIGQKYGKTKLYAIEYYKNKERKIGPITVEVAPGRINPDYKNIEMDLYHDMTLLEAIDIQNMNFLAEYSCTVADSSIVSVNKRKEILAFDIESVSYILSGKKEGTTTLTVYETFKGKKKNLGTVNITMKDLITEFTFDPDLCSSEDGLLKYNFYLDEEETPDDNIYEFILKEPQYQINGDVYQYKYNIQFTSSDESVIKIADKGEIILGKQGTAILKATCGGFTTELHVTVEQIPLLPFILRDIT